MKTCIMTILLLTGSMNLLLAQTNEKIKKARPATTQKVTTKKKTVKRPSTEPGLLQLSSSEANQALGKTSPVTRFSIADPTINALNARAKGMPVNIGKSGIVGVPKGTYGYSNGHIFFKTTDATSTGTTTGSGTVGTGTSIGTIGTASPVIGVNGKSPYAGTTMWGTNLRTMRIDSLHNKE